MTSAEIEEAAENKRTIFFTGTTSGVKCDFPVQIIKRHPSVEGYYHVSAVFADNVWYEPDWAHVRDLKVT